VQSQFHWFHFPLGRLIGCISELIILKIGVIKDAVLGACLSIKKTESLHLEGGRQCFRILRGAEFIINFSLKYCHSPSVADSHWVCDLCQSSSISKTRNMSIHPTIKTKLNHKTYNTTLAWAKWFCDKNLLLLSYNRILYSWKSFLVHSVLLGTVNVYGLFL